MLGNCIAGAKTLGLFIEQKISRGNFEILQGLKSLDWILKLGQLRNFGDWNPWI